MEFKKVDIYVISFFVFFAAFFSFACVSSSAFFLDGDTANIANWALRDLYWDIFKVDPIIGKDNVYYLKSHMFIVKSFMGLTGSYIQALKLLMFLQTSLALITTFYMIKGLFRNINILYACIASFLMTMVYVKVPIFECTGFIDLRNVTARATFSIFIPLFILYYFRGKDIRLGRVTVPKIFAIAIAGALISQLHPQTGITVVATIFLHWMLVHRYSMNRKKLLFIAIGAIPFAIGIYFFLDSFSVATFKMGAVRYVITKISELFTTEQYFSQNFFTLNSYWLLQFTFLPYIFVAAIMLFFYRSLPEDAEDRNLFLFLRGIFFCALGMHLFFGFFGYHFLAFSQIGLGQIFMRSTKFVFSILEILALFYILRGRCFIKSRLLHAICSLAIIFCILIMSGTRLDFQHSMLARLFPYVPFIDENNEFKYNVIARLPIIAVLFSILVIGVLSRKKELWKNILILYCSVVMLVLPVMAGAVKMKAGDIFDSTAGLGSWSLLGKISSSRCAVELNSFEDAKKWVAANTSPGAMIFMMIKPSDGQRFKIAALRPGVGDAEDGCIQNLDSPLKIELEAFYQSLKKQPENADLIIGKKMNEFSCKILLVHKMMFPDIEKALDKKLPLVHSNECYNIYANQPDNRTTKIGNLL